MVDRSRLEAICKTLAKEHGLLMGLIERIRSEGQGPALLRHVKRLRELLIVHFAREQLSDGLYDTLDGMLEGHDEELGDLIEEHRAILHCVNQLLERMTDADSEKANEAMSRLPELTEMISRHEHREHDLVTKLLEA